MGLWEGVWILPVFKKLGTDGVSYRTWILSPGLHIPRRLRLHSRGSPRQPQDPAWHVHLTHICGRDLTLTRGLPQLLLSSVA